MTVRPSVSFPVSRCEASVWGHWAATANARQAFLLPCLCLLPLATVPTTTHCRKPSGGLIYPPPDSLAGSHRKGCPQGPLQACEDSQWLRVCVMESPGRARGAGSQENRARQGWELDIWAGVGLSQSSRANLSICPLPICLSPTQRRPSSPCS